MLLTLSPLSIIKLGVILLGLFNLALTLKGFPSRSSWSVTKPRQIRVRIKDHPDIELLHLDLPPRTTGLKLFTEETVHYPISGPRAELEWASLVPEGNHGLVILNDSPDADAHPRAYAVSMFHTLHCLDRIRRAIVEPPELQSAYESTTATWSRARYHVHHCFNYVRQMVLCAADTRLNPTDRVQPSGRPAADGIGLMYECRDWKGVYDAFDANYALNQTLSFAH